ncbi:hypothetical protein EVG20_g502 [Dentipellis fragilis]|uniref:IMD domain-containing protein n=1 Tax=Dentipellis fragilis TaxID=205917 RepID=A0A4Y9ZCK8_9AGAM|nr:hypothetical protein EVG20_g502 [Dentipellis fragilis]
MPRPRSLRSLAINANQPRRSGSPGGGPPSPTFSEATNASAMNFGEDGPAKIITRADLRSSMQAYENLLNSCAAYRTALLSMSKVTAAFADAMEGCAGLKGPSYEQGTRLQAASGLHHLIGNHWAVLAETLNANFEKPLRQHLETYRTIVNERSASYEKALREKSHIIRETEKRSMNRKERNLQSFREALTILQRQVDDLDELKSHHYEEILEHEEEVWDVVQGKICLVVRSTLDVFDRFTAKASDPVIEPMLQSVPDPFDSPLTATPQSEMSDAFATGTNAWTQNEAIFSEPASEWADATSPSSSPPASVTPRSTSPPSRAHRPSSPGFARRTESKLRSVLSVIDEARPKDKDKDVGPTTDATTSSSSTNGIATPTASARNSGVSWSTFPFGDRSRAGSQDVTPRNSTLLQSTPPPELDPGPDTDAPRSRTPQSDDTAVPVSS